MDAIEDGEDARNVVRTFAQWCLQGRIGRAVSTTHPQADWGLAMPLDPQGTERLLVLVTGTWLTIRTDEAGTARSPFPLGDLGGAEGIPALDGVERLALGLLERSGDDGITVTDWSIGRNPVDSSAAFRAIAARALDTVDATEQQRPGTFSAPLLDSVGAFTDKLRNLMGVPLAHVATSWTSAEVTPPARQPAAAATTGLTAKR